MKWSVQQLNKLTNIPYEFVEKINFDQNIEFVSDLISLSPVIVTGRIKKLSKGIYDIFEVNYRIQCQLILECALTLEPVEFQFDNIYNEIFTTEEIVSQDDVLVNDIYTIEKNTLDLSEAVWSNIIIDKPMIVKHPNAYKILEERGIILNDIPEDDH